IEEKRRTESETSAV
ncbi:LOW QUALITY PROTEIN: hypothetical protein C348_06445, partial [Cryptococcus neoformans Gb118]